jgi:capsid portal protein
LREVIKKAILDKKSSGNGFFELVTNARRSFLNIYHQDSTKCRLSKDKKSIYLHHDWRIVGGTKGDRKQIPLYPIFEDTLKDGYLRSMIHIKEYEPGFENYGVPDWIAGLNVSAIAYKTDKWNISRLDNSFNSSGVLIVNGEFQSDEDYEDFQTEFKQEFVGEGKQGKILMMAQSPGALPDAGTRFVPVTQNAEADWQNLHLQSTNDLVIAHGAA